MKTYPSYPAFSPFQLWSWLARYCAWVLKVCAGPYASIARFRRTCYHRGWVSQHRLPKPVISVGNITVGGTGKTPFVILLAKQLHAQGKRVAILSRGYGRQNSSQNMLVSDGKRLRTDWQFAGDEPVVIAKKCPWAVVAVGNDRYRLGQWVEQQIPCDCFILDDGYQHLPLYRDLDLLVFDATDLQGLAGVLPAGRMREPLDAAQWAHGFVLSRSECVPSIRPLQERIEKALGKGITPIVVRSVAKSLTHLSTGTVKEVAYFYEKAILVFSGIGNPDAFSTSLAASGFNVQEAMAFPDHFVYSGQDVEAIRKKMKDSGVEIAVTTEKDQGKLQAWCTQDDPIWVLNMELEVVTGEETLQELLRTHEIV